MNLIVNQRTEFVELIISRLQSAQRNLCPARVCFPQSHELARQDATKGLCSMRIMEAQVCRIVLLVTGGLLKASRSRM